MRKFLPIIIIVAVAVLTFTFLTKAKPAPNPSSTNQITISATNGIAKKGSTYEIKWTKGEGKTDIFLVDRALESEGVSVSLADRVYNVDNNGSYAYTIPKNIPSGEYQLRIGDATSDYFQIN